MSWDTIKRLFGAGKAKVETADTAETATSQPIFNSLEKSRRGFGERLKQLFNRSQGSDEQSLIADLEEVLYAADLGPNVVTMLLATLTELPRPLQRDAVLQRWYDTLSSLIGAHGAIPLYDNSQSSPHVIFLVGVNGAGKTTSIAKLANYYKTRQGKKVMLAAADTFRAAASSQLQVWAERLGIECIAQAEGADPAAVVFDAVQAAKARGADILLVDTGGRLHTKQNLMDSLKKMQRSVEKAGGRSVDATLLVLDATMGQNGLEQAKEFHQSAKISGIIVSKLDSSARGGALVGICRTLSLPVFFVGTGEGINDLQPFDAAAYAAGLLYSE